MPRRAKWESAALGPRSASVSTVLSYTAYYHWTCEKDPLTGEVEVYSASAEGEPPVHGAYLASLRSIDSVRTVKSKRNWRMNPCHHIVSKVDYPSEGDLEFNRDITGWIYPGGEEGVCEYAERTLERLTDTFVVNPGKGTLDAVLDLDEDWAPTVSDPYLPIGTQLFDDKVRQLCEIALDTMIPELEGKFKAPVFVAELFEVRQLVDHLKGFLRSPGLLPSSLIKLWHKPLNEISGHWLASVFGWLPFVSDIKTIANLIISDTKVRDFFENANKRQTLHFKKGLSPETFRPEEWFLSNSTLSGDFADYGWEFLFDAGISEFEIQLEHERKVEDLDFHATLDFEYRCPPATSVVAQILAGLDRWGINFSPSDVWELVPFSFVVDWFVGIGDQVARFDKTNLPVQVVIHDFCWSIKYSMSEEVRATELTDLVWSGGTHGSASDWTIPHSTLVKRAHQVYYRSPDKPAPKPEQLTLGLPRGWTWVTATALLTQQTEELRRKFLRVLRDAVRR